MNKNTVLLYIAYRHTQYASMVNRSLSPEELVTSFNLARSNHQYRCFKIPTLESLMSRYDTSSRTINFLDKLPLIGSCRKTAYTRKILVSITKLALSISSKPLNNLEFEQLYKEVNLLYLNRYFADNEVQDILKISIENILLRAYLNTSETLPGNAIDKLQSFFDYARPDFNMLYKLTNDICFFSLSSPRADVVDSLYRIDVWDYILAASTKINHGNFGGKLFKLCKNIKPQTMIEYQNKKELLANAIFWLGKQSIFDKKILRSLSAYKRPILNPEWYIKKHEEKLKIVSEFIKNKPELAYFIFNKLDVAKLSTDILKEIITVYQDTEKDYNIFKAIEAVELLFNKFYKSVYSKTPDEIIERNASRVIALDNYSQGPSRLTLNAKNSRLLAKKLIDDCCPITLNKFMSFYDDETPIIKLNLYTQPSLACLNSKIGTCGINAYELQEFTKWVGQYRCDATYKDIVCLAPDAVSKRVNKKLLRRFINILRLKSTGLIDIVSEDWFTYGKLTCLLSLEPRLYDPKYLKFIELLDISKIELADIDYINNYYKLYKDLPSEIVFLNQSVVTNSFCATYTRLKGFNLDIMNLFKKFEHGICVSGTDVPIDPIESKDCMMVTECEEFTAMPSFRYRLGPR